MRLFLDTETSGLLRDELPDDHPSQPHLVQLGAQLFDPKWERRASVDCLIKPDGWTIEPDAYAVHGITDLQCSRYGVPLAAALVILKGLVACSLDIVCHHAQFDRRIIAIQLAKLKAEGAWWARRPAAFFCTMEESIAVCNLRGEFGPKYPSLHEAHRHFYPDVPYVTRHKVAPDIAATVRVYRALKGEREHG